MIVDTSVLVAILRREEGYERYIELITKAEYVGISAVTFLETTVVIRDQAVVKTLCAFFEFPDPIAFDVYCAAEALKGWEQYGKDRHSAGLNLGDCAVYGTAKHHKEPLLFKGNDFSQTDIKKVV